MKNGAYELVLAPEEYPGKRYRDRYCYEHHLVWWQHTGDLVPDGHIVHHKNEDGRDNRIENLDLMLEDDHKSHHASGEAMITITCAYCGSEFEKCMRNYKHKSSKGQEDFYCNRSCMAKHFGRGRPKYCGVL